MDLMNFPEIAAGPDSSLETYNFSVTKRFFPYEKFDHPDKMQNAEQPPEDAF